MRLLLDTHVWIWWRSQPGKLSPRVVRLIESEKTLVFFSAASVWEVAIKVARGRLKLMEPVDRFFHSRLEEDRIEELGISHQHAIMTADVHHIHRDPFDRMLIAQARCEKLTLVTADDNILKYDSSVMNAR